MLQFGSLHLDVGARELTVDGVATHLEPQAFDLLAYLVHHRERVVPKSELLDEVWGDQFVSESALTTRVKEIRQATGDDGRRQEVIKNVRGRGYRFVATLTTPAEPAEHHHGRRRVPSRPATTSVGIDTEIMRLAGHLADRRLVTVVGPGGVGKTRLATEVARVVAERHALGARVVELSRIGEPEAIEPTICRALDRGESYLEFDEGFGAIDALLVLDNCEHLIDAVATHLPSLFAGGDVLRVLTTSREPLGVPGELRVVLSPLATAGVDAPAMTLFVERARDVGVEVDPADERAQAIVSHLDGIPLALEMGAARLATMGVADVAAEVERSVASLTAGPRGVPERHATLRNVLAWSEALLSHEQRAALADLSVFAGPVEAVDLPATVSAVDPISTVLALAERSLVTVDTTDAGRARYGSLETVRQFGRSRLQEEGRFDAVSHRHAQWFTEAAEHAAVLYDTVDQADAVARIDAVFDELRAAHHWARHHDLALAMRLSRALCLPAVQQLRLEVFEWSAALAALVDTDQPGVALLFGELALGLSMVGRIDDARSWAERAIGTATDEVEIRAAFGALADVHLYTGDLEQSLAFARHHAELTAMQGSWTERATAAANVALPLSYLGRHEEALDAVPRAVPDEAPPLARAWLSYARGEVLLDIEPDIALGELDSAIAIAESVDGLFLSGVAQVSAASLRSRSGRPADAIIPMARTIERLAGRGSSTHLLTTLRNLPTLLVRLDAWDGAAQLLGGLSTATISPTFGDEAERLSAAEAAVRAVLDADEYAAAHAVGAGRSLDQLARFAVGVLTNLAAAPEG